MGIIIPYLSGDTPRWRCPKCGLIMENPSWYWIKDDILAHTRSHYQRMKDDGRQEDLAGHMAMAVKEGKKGMNISEAVQINLFGKSSGGESQTMPWKKREGTTWGGKGLKNGDSIEGELLKLETNANSTEKRPLHDYFLKGKDGEVRVWGAAFLEGKLGESDIGKEVRITFKGLGKAKKGQNPPKQFDVEVRE